MLSSYLSTRSAEGAIGRDSHCVQVASVANVVSLQLAVGQVPHLETERGVGDHVSGYIKGNVV